MAVRSQLKRTVRGRSGRFPVPALVCARMCTRPRTFRAAPVWPRTVGTESNSSGDARPRASKREDNVFCYRSPTPDNSQSTRNDVTLSLGIAYHLR